MSGQRQGVLIVGQGSRLEDNQRLILRMAEALRSLNEFGPIVPCFLRICKPTMLEGLDRLAEEGVEDVYVLPCSLASPIRFPDDVKDKIEWINDEMTLTLRDKRLVLNPCSPIGCDERLASVLADRVRSRIERDELEARI